MAEVEEGNYVTEETILLTTEISEQATVEETTSAETTTKQTTATTAKRQSTTYDGSISEVEYEYICRIVMHEAGDEPYEGIVAVTQCYLNAMEKENADAYAIHDIYGYANGRNPDSKVKSIVYDVIYNGLSVTDEPILYFYAPAYCSSPWHESQIFVMEIGGHRFFKEAM